MTEQSKLEYRKLGLSIDAMASGIRLDAYLAENFKFLSRSAWQHRIDAGQALVNSKPQKASYRLQVGDQLSMYYPQNWEPEVEDNLSVVFKDNYLAVIAKPPGLPMHTVGAFFNRHFAGSLQKLLGLGWAAVHRLDRETSGIVVVAHSLKVRAALTEQFMQHTIKKKYLCICEGVPANAEWQVDAPIGSALNSQIRIKKWVNQIDGQAATTNFKLLETKNNYSLIEASPITGRTNQIRIHLAYVGHRIIGDKLYHPSESVFLDYDENGDSQRIWEQTGFKRVCLHAYSIEFVHPVTGELIQKNLPMWEDMQKFWQEIKK